MKFAEIQFLVLKFQQMDDCVVRPYFLSSPIKRMAASEPLLTACALREPRAPTIFIRLHDSRNIISSHWRFGNIYPDADQDVWESVRLLIRVTCVEQSLPINSINHVQFFWFASEHSFNSNIVAMIRRWNSRWHQARPSSIGQQLCFNILWNVEDLCIKTSILISDTKEMASIKVFVKNIWNRSYLELGGNSFGQGISSSPFNTHSHF